MFLLLALLSCEQSEELSYMQFNQPDDHLKVYIGPELLPEAQNTLHSSTGLVEIGFASVSPGASGCHLLCGL